MGICDRRGCDSWNRCLVPAAMKSPFVIHQDFFSPLQCEKLIQLIGFDHCTRTPEDKPDKTIRSSELGDQMIFEKLEPLIPSLEEHYNLKYAGTAPMTYEWYPEGCQQQPPQAENSKFLRKKWVKVYNRELTGIVFLSQYQDQGTLDPACDVYGGKIQFPQHDFSLQSETGSLVIYPSYPHFVSVISQIDLGNLYLARFHIAAKEPWLYDPKQYQGTYKEWFEKIA